MTIRVPKSVFFGVIAVLAIAAFGVGGYVLGRQSQDETVTTLKNELARNKSAAKSDRLDRFVYQKNEAHLLRNLCSEIVRIRPAFGSLNPDGCDIQNMSPPPRLRSTSTEDGRLLSAIATMCEMVFQIQGTVDPKPNSRVNCNDGYMPLPSSPPIPSDLSLP